MHDYTLHRGCKHVCRYFLKGFGTAETLTCYIEDFFKINGKQKIKMPNKGKYRLKNYERKIKSPFMIYVVLKVYYCQKIMGSKIQMSLYKQISKVFCWQLWL